MAEKILAEFADHQCRRTGGVDQSDQRGIHRCGGHHDQDDGQQQPGHILRTLQAGMQVEASHQPQAGCHHQRLGPLGNDESAPAQRHALEHVDAGVGDNFRTEQPAPMAHWRKQQGSKSQAVREHPVRLHGWPQQQPQQQIASAKQGA